MIPLSDENPTVRPAVMTGLLLAAIGVVWVVVEGAGTGDRLVRAVCTLGLVPGELTGLAPLDSGVPIAPGLFCAVDAQPLNWLTPILSMFLHGGWMHLLGNALFLWVFGNNIEDIMGHGRFIVFYVTCGILAALSHALTDPTSTVPMVGASGAISGVLGAYLLLFPHARVLLLAPVVGTTYVPAGLVLGFWFVMQLLNGGASLGSQGGGVAFFAHIGGFIAGMLLIGFFKRPEVRFFAPTRPRSWRD